MEELFIFCDNLYTRLIHSFFIWSSLESPLCSASLRSSMNLIRGPFFFFVHNYLPESPIRAVDKFCVQPQRASCQIPDETTLVYKSPADCSKEYQKFIYDDGVLMHKCSGKYVCPRGLFKIQIFRGFL